MSIKLTVNATSLLKQMEKAHAQVAFATAKTLTQAAFEARSAVQANLPKWLEIKKPFLQKSVVVNKASKNNLEAEVGFLDRAKLAPLLEKGGTRKPAQSRTIAVPVNATKTGKSIPKSRRPKALLARNDTFSAEINGVAGIWQRQKNRLVLVYAYEPTTSYEPNKMHFFKTAKIVAIKTIDKKLEKNILDAFKTAK